MHILDEGNTWPKYSGPVTVGSDKVVYSQSVSSDGALQSRVVTIDEECADCGEKLDSAASSEGEATTTVQSEYSSGGNALKLASDLSVMVDMGKNFDHDADCSMGDWGLCYTQSVMIDYRGTENYLNR